MALGDGQKQERNGGGRDRAINGPCPPARGLTAGIVNKNV